MSMNAKHNSDSGLRVFISSTFEDLRAYREAAKEAALGAEMLPRMQEYFNAAGDRPPLARCLAEVAACDLTVVIVAHRYGWIPADQPAGQAKSITRLEVDQAIEGGQEVLAFLVDDKQAWPEDLREESPLMAAVRTGKATAEQLKAVQENVERLKAFKDWLSGRGIRGTFTTPEHLRRLVAEALADWRKRNLAPEAAVIRLAPSDPTRYLESLRDQTSHIDIRGLQVGTGRVHRFPIEDLFISLTTTALPAHARRRSPDNARAGLPTPPKPPTVRSPLRTGDLRSPEWHGQETGHNPRETGHNPWETGHKLAMTARPSSAPRSRCTPPCSTIT